ncbi:sulfite exporter TauE/SafE family protein [Chromohalobacter israelensis]|uniref:sulfite exporter TauE/SafE family protein n=1 Tax=Chromohalobacter israelensis TaxID=141390 RepID=UPI001CC39E62|nr:sulfite exporter TauE/SafE family protein [Chromohalobacter salexigens]MBZ5876218.1 sulfite exporter TauE/SafE family protein [Chromohalobacter salexigens]
MNSTEELIVVFVCLALGGILKGATGAGAPMLVVPALTMMFDVQFAVVVMLVPNLITNLWQAWRFRKERLPGSFTWPFSAAGVLGVVTGTLILANLPPMILSLIVASSVFVYIFFRLIRPDWVISFGLAQKLSFPAGLTAGMLQGASGLSMPISVSFLNAMRLDRAYFISTVSVFFVCITALQIPTLEAIGFLTLDRLLISMAALLPILAFMPLGARIAQRLSKEVFDRIVLVLLGCLAVKLVIDALL